MDPATAKFIAALREAGPIATCTVSLTDYSALPRAMAVIDAMRFDNSALTPESLVIAIAGDVYLRVCVVMGLEHNEKMNDPEHVIVTGEFAEVGGVLVWTDCLLAKENQFLPKGGVVSIYKRPAS